MQVLNNTAQMFARGYGEFSSKSVGGGDAAFKRTGMYSQHLLELNSPYPPAHIYREFTRISD
ncbi:MAG: hypothetical protein V3U62_02410, partial [Sedimenticolaceae bacterium]